MPKKFNEQEKEWIRKKLLDTGRRRFESAGLRKTSVEELTKEAGIAQGSFYLFFGSKEELYYELLLEEEATIREKLIPFMDSDNLLSKEGIVRFLLHSFRLMSENPLIRHMYLEGEFEQLVRKLPKELLERNYSEDQDAFKPVILKWQAAGILSHTKPELIVSMLRAIILLSLHKKEIGQSIYADTIELLVNVIAGGMISTRED